MDELEKYYEYLKGAKADVPDTYQSFRNTLSDENSAKQYYQYLRDNKFDTPDNYDSFSNTFELKKKGITTLPSKPLDGTLPLPAQEDDAITASLKADELSKKREALPGLNGLSMPDKEATAQAKQINDNVTKQGENPKELANEFKDFPQDAFDREATSKPNLLQLKKENPIQYQNVLNSTKTVYNIAKNSDIHTANEFNHLNDLHYGSMEEFVKGKQRQQQIIDATLSGDEKEKAHSRLEQNAAPLINAVSPDLVDEYKSSPLAGVIDPNQYAGLKTLQVFEPSKYEQAVKILQSKKDPNYEPSAGVSFSNDGFKMGNVTEKETDESIDYKKGLEAVKLNLANIGRSNATTFANKNLYDLDNEYKKYDTTADEKLYSGYNDKIKSLKTNIDGYVSRINSGSQLTENEKKDYVNDINTFNETLNIIKPLESKLNENISAKNNIQQQYLKQKGILNDVKLDASKDDEKYPLSAQMKFDDQVKELTQSSGINPFEYGIYHFGKGFEKSGNSLNNVATSIFGSEDDNTVNQATSLGQSRTDASDAYLPSTLKSEQPNVIFNFPKEVKEQRDAILKDDSLSDSEKQYKLGELVQNNQSKIQSVTNPNAGKSANFWSKATIYGNAGVLGDLASIAAQSAGLSIAGAGKLLSASVPMMTTSQDDFFKQAVEEGNPNPDAYANLHALVMGAAGLINPDINIVKRSLGMNTAVGKLIAGVDEATWNSILSENKPLLQKFINSAKSVAGEAGKITAVYGAGTSIANDLLDKGLFDKNISGSDMLNHAVRSSLDMAKNSLVLFGVNAISNFKNVSSEQKARIWENGTNPEIGIQQVDDAVKSGKLDKVKGEQYKSVIKNTAKLIDQVPTENAKGKSLTDKDRVDYLYNSVVKNKAKDLSKDMPARQAEKLDHAALVADHANNLILEPKTYKQLETVKDQLEKVLEPKKDANGKVIELDEKTKKDTEAELEAVNNAIGRKENRVEVTPPQSFTEPITIGNKDGTTTNEPLKEIQQDSNDKIKKLEEERDKELAKVSKPNLKLNLVSSKDLVNSKDPVGNKEIHDNIKEKYKKLKQLIECL